MQPVNNRLWPLGERDLSDFLLLMQINCIRWNKPNFSVQLLKQFKDILQLFKRETKPLSESKSKQALMGTKKT